MKARADGQGHHPKARLYIPTIRIRGRIRLIKLDTLKAWQLAMLKIGMNFATTKRERSESDALATSDEALLEMKVVEIGCADTKAWYIDTNGCGMLQANPANSPPKNGFVRMAMRRAAILLLSMMMLVVPNACHKDPMPAPIPEGTDTIYVPFEWGIHKPDIDTIKFYANQPRVKKIIMDLVPMDSFYTTAWYWRPFHNARDTLQKRIDVAPNKVCGRGTIIVYQVVPDEPSWFTGLPRSDSIAFAKMGFDIYARRH